MQPPVSIVTVNYNGERFLRPLLRSLSEQNYSNFEIIIVDNASSDESVEIIASEYPNARLIRSSKNLGFAAGNNLGVKHANGQYIALINNDTIVAKDWLQELIKPMLADATIAATASKILFRQKFLRLRFDLVANLDHHCQIQIGENSQFKNCDYFKPLFVRGIVSHQKEGEIRTFNVLPPATLLLPYDEHAENQEIQLFLRSVSMASDACRVRISSEDRTIAEVNIDEELRSYTIAVTDDVLKQNGTFIINNVGSYLDNKGNARDRGIFERDCNQFKVFEEVEAFCGCSVAMNRKVFDDLGGFDEDYFMYYEDTDMSWRIRDSGYRILFIPTSVVYHVHAGSSVEFSPFFNFQVSRNRVLLTMKNATLLIAATDYFRECIIFLKTLRRVFPWCSPAQRSEFKFRLSIQRSLLKFLVPSIYRRMRKTECA